jgi:hypothetical protein
MNIKFFLIAKALNVLPSEIVKIIWEKLEIISANVIKDNLQKLAFKKFRHTNRVYLQLIQFTDFNIYFRSNYIITKFLNWQKSVNFLYIDDTTAWLNALNSIRYRYYNKHLSFIVNGMMNDIKYKKREYKVRVGRFFSDNAIMSTKQYVSWIYRSDVMNILLQSYNSINEIPPTEFIRVINMYETTYNIKNFSYNYNNKYITTVSF